MVINLILIPSPLEHSHTLIKLNFSLILKYTDVYLLGDNCGHGDLQELLLQRDKGQKAGVEEA